MAAIHPRNNLEPNCPDCASAPLSRREFVRGLGAGALATALPWAGARAFAGGADKKPLGPTPSDAAETAVARFYKSLKPEHRKVICFPFDHRKRSMVNNNWAIVEPTIDDLGPEQKALCQEIMKNLCSEEGYERFMKQMEDDSGGLENYHVAVFGEPGTDKPFEWVLSGRHDTLRADGNSLDGAAFGGPIFYGHAADGHNTEDAQHTHNVWWYQGEQANKIFKTLGPKERARALVARAEADKPSVIKLKGDRLKEQKTGIAIADLDGQQKAMVSELITMMLSPFRAVDAAEARAYLDHNGGVDAFRMTFFEEGDLGKDGVWDIWKLEGPAFSWYFRGSPHVHTWLNVARQA